MIQDQADGITVRLSLGHEDHEKCDTNELGVTNGVSLEGASIVPLVFKPSRKGYIESTHG